MEELLTVHEVAAVLKVKPQTVYDMIRQGRLAAVKLGPKVLRVEPQALRSLLEAHRRDAA